MASTFAEYDCAFMECMASVSAELVVYGAYGFNLL